MKTSFVIGSRGSELALTQSRWVAARLAALHPGVTCNIQIIKTTGDAPTLQAAQLGKGVFVKEIEEALLGGAIDVAVHSLKDLPTDQPPGLWVGAVPPREDPLDALITLEGRALAELTVGAVVATSSPRRRVQLLDFRNHLAIREIKGNVGTRLAKVDNREVDAVVVAHAGLSRLGLGARPMWIIPADLMLPAPGQGALGIEIRSEDAEARAWIAGLDDPIAHRAVLAERSCLKALGGGCRMPMGALAEVSGEEMVLRGVLANEQETRLARAQVRGPADQAESLGARLAEQLLGLLNRP